MDHQAPLPSAGTLAELHARQEQVALDAMTTGPPPLQGAGIVMVAGGPALTAAWVAIAILREVQRCDLPIQVWYLGPDELTPAMRRLPERFGVELVDAFAVRREHPMRRLGPWECKAYAALRSPFRHVILLDADNVPLIDPATLLAAPEYAETGTIFWPDNHMHLPDSPVWNLFDVPYREELEVESGQVVIDTARCWAPLSLAVHYNAWSDVYYRYIYGDKETFHFAWRRLDQPWAMPEGRPHSVYFDKVTPHGRKRMTAALEQRDFQGNIIFHHRTGAKWTIDGENVSTGRPALDDACLDALAELRTLQDAPPEGKVNACVGRPPRPGSGTSSPS